MSNKAKLNYAIDVGIGLMFILGALSGFILFVVPSGYQGGQNPHYGQTVLWLTTHQWNELHTWSSMAMISGVFAHLVLHWNWMVCMTKKLLKGPKPKVVKSSGTACPIE